MGQVRTALRLALGTWTADVDAAANIADSDSPLIRGRALEGAEGLPMATLGPIASGFAEQLHGDRLGFPNAAFVLALRPDNAADFYAWLRAAPPTISCDILFAERGNVAGDWVVVPADAPAGMLLRFGLPAALLTWLVAVDGAEAERAFAAKQDLFSTITIFVDGRTYTLDSALAAAGATGLGTMTGKRSTRRSSKSAPTPAFGMVGTERGRHGRRRTGGLESASRRRAHQALGL